MAAAKKHEEAKVEEPKTEEKINEPVIVSDIVTEETESIEVVEEVTPQAPKEESKKESEEPEEEKDPLSEFKEKMNEEEYTPYNKKPQKNFMWPILFIFVAALLVLVGIFLYKKGTIPANINVVSLSPTPSLAPTPTEEPVDLSKYPVRILNGSGVSGEAARQQEELESAGFTVDSVGNADNSDYTDTIIRAKEEVTPAFLNKLKETLEESFTLGPTESLAETSATPVVVILGTKK